MTPTNRNFGLPSMAITVALLVAACGSGSDTGSAGVASLDEGTGSNESAASSSEAPADPNEAHQLYVKCMADAGYNNVDGNDSGGLTVGADDGSGGDSAEGEQNALQEDEGFIAAADECAKHLANIDLDYGLTPEEKAARDDANLAFTQCMAEHGVALGTVGGSGLDVDADTDDGDDAGPGGGAGEFDPEVIEKAEEACLGHLTGDGEGQ